MEKQEAEELLERYIAGTASPEENAWVETWYARFEDKVSSVAQEQVAADELESWEKLVQDLKRKPALKLWPRLVAAASVVLVIGIGLFFLNRQSIQSVVIAQGSDIKPGLNGAFLKLANGKRISLNATANGKLATESGITITKTKDGELVYTLAEDQHTANIGGYNTIETPAGGQYQLKLPDGTNIWLNASSSLKYPVSFASLKERRIELVGEAFFEVKHNAAQPFRVLSKGQLVEDIGTTFNINSYGDELTVSTTLIEGAARVSLSGNVVSSKLLKPGQQSIATFNSLSVKEVNTDNVVAWKNGMFMFYDEPLVKAMRKISRWYGVKVIFEDPALEQLSTYGTISKFNSLSKVLEMMAKAGSIRFEVKEKTITIIKSTN